MRHRKRNAQALSECCEQLPLIKVVPADSAVPVSTLCNNAVGLLHRGNMNTSGSDWAAVVKTLQLVMSQLEFLRMGYPNSFLVQCLSTRYDAGRFLASLVKQSGVLWHLQCLAQQLGALHATVATMAQLAWNLLAPSLYLQLPPTVGEQCSLLLLAELTAGQTRLKRPVAGPKPREPFFLTI
jgi:hypothetical protein